MSRLGKKIEALMSAISFAEEGEFDTGKEILSEKNSPFEQLKELRQKAGLTLDEIGNLTSKVTTFSEAGEYEKAKKIMAEINTMLESIKKIFREISNVTRVIYAPKVISGEGKRLCTSGNRKKYYYNYYRYKEANNGK